MAAPQVWLQGDDLIVWHGAGRRYERIRFGECGIEQVSDVDELPLGQGVVRLARIDEPNLLDDPTRLQARIDELRAKIAERR